MFVWKMIKGLARRLAANGDILRLGLVQTALGAIVVLTTSTMNRVMVVELSLPAMLPGALVGLYSGIQITRPRWGHASDVGGRRTPWILRGMAILAAGGIMASLAVAWMATSVAAGVTLAVLAFATIGVGVGAAGTSLLTLLAVSVEESRKAVAASVVWLMMIAGFVVTTIMAGQYLDPFSMTRLVTVTTTVALCALALTALALWGFESRRVPPTERLAEDGPKPSFFRVLAEVWDEHETRDFTIFVFISMLAYNTQDLILEPFAGAVFGLTPGQSTQLTGVQHSGVFLGMIAVAIAASGRGVGGRPGRLGSTRLWTVIGCVCSALALAGLTVSAFAGGDWPIRETVFALGLCNGAFAVGAIGWMMSLAGGESRQGIRMGLWGGAQAIAFAMGGFLGTMGVDVIHFIGGASATAYAGVFAVEATLFILAAVLATRMMRTDREFTQSLSAPAVIGAVGGSTS